MISAAALALELDTSAIAKIVLFLVILVVWIVRQGKAQAEPRKLHEGLGVPHPQPVPPAVAHAKPLPPAPPRHAIVAAAARPKRPVKPVLLSQEGRPAAKLAPKATEEAPGKTFAAAKDLTQRTAAVQGAGARAVPPSGRALLKAGDLPRRDRIRAAVLWSEVLSPPISRRGPRRLPYLGR